MAVPAITNQSNDSTSSQFEIDAVIRPENPRDSVPLHDTSPTKPPPPLSFATDSTNDDVEAGSLPSCRICFETDTDGDELISPCMCKGTQQFVHRGCLDNWRSVKEGFAFTHCTTCRAQFHLRVVGEQVKSWRNIKFKLFVARDVFLVFLAVQAVIAALGGFAYAMDKDGTLRNSCNYSWDRIFSKHPVPFYYTVGFLSFIGLLVLLGVIRLLVFYFSAQSTRDDHQTVGCCFPWRSDSFCETMGSCIGLAIFTIALFAMFGIAFGMFAFSMLFQRIWQRHHHIIAKKELTKEYVVVDLKGQYTPPTLDPEHEEHLRIMKLL